MPRPWIGLVRTIDHQGSEDAEDDEPSLNEITFDFLFFHAAYTRRLRLEFQTGVFLESKCSRSTFITQNLHAMTQTLVKNYIHIVLTTQKREPLIHVDLQDHLFKYIGGVCRNLECQPFRVGGFRDHVHILCALNKNLCLVELVEEIKIASARWVRNKFDPSSNFSWQRGYAGVSVAREDLGKLSHYIETQKEHHSSMTLQAELQRLMMEDAEEISMWQVTSRGDKVTSSR